MFFAYNRSRKSHFLLFGYGCLTLLAVSVIHLYRHSKEIHHTQQKNRNVATQIITKHTSQKDLTYYFCSHFYPTICQLKKDTSDPTGSVRKNIKGEILALQTYQEILRENSNLSVDEYDELFVKKVYTSKRRHRIQSAFHYVQNALLRYIDKQNNHIFTDREKKFLKNRLKKIKLELPPPASLYQDEPDLFTKNNILYERLTDNSLRLRVGGAYLFTVQSWFNLIFSMSHELAHSIDPCELKFLQIYIPSYDKLLACFIKQGLVQIHNERSECGENDELSETFADWIAVQIIAETLKKFKTEFDRNQLFEAATNAVRDLCEDEDERQDISTHPSAAIRIENIFSQNPIIQTLFDCPPELNSATYCDFE